ncbi:acyl-CoA Delta(11) desaturase-like [Trichoplusia ni]|uniref:Acyl-CoA Delta(11) desaturase-like n=1 Tax=Trichoplusia ni TaxID=7111 RepID=A0A7E5VX09_TRINI|nr:acyl-CoA Delta(11) desaturase-like [Trichoplusia ni]
MRHFRSTSIFKLLFLLSAYLLFVFSSVSVTAGVHRLWSHRAYKAKLPLRIFLLFFYTMAYQGSVLHWVRDHRVHHKHCDTDADPHNSKKGFFFAQIGWMLAKKHPDVIAKGNTIDVSDILSDPLLRLQNKYYFHVVFIICYMVPTYIPTLWGEEAWTAFFVAGVLRHLVSVHTISLINSAAHIYGTKPYDKSICPAENMTVSLLASGEGFHNYHHTFPWDYKAAELGGYSLNFATFFIDVMAKIGWAYGLKTVSEDLIEKRVKKTGDGSHPVWGWNDKDMPEDDRKSAIIS